MTDIPHLSAIGRCHVIPVHGTWGAGFWHSVLWDLLPPHRQKRTTQWPICDKLQAVGVVVHPTFTWSGKNNNHRRMEAGKELAAYIAGLKLQPSDQLFIVAHSHGGNVALYALRHPGAERVEGIVFLATPFLQFAPQNFPFAGFRLLPFAIRNAVAIIVGSVLLALAAIIGKPFVGAKQPLDAVFWGFVVSIVAVSFGVAYVFGFLAERAVRRMSPKTEAALNEVQPLCEYYQPPPPQRCGALILRKAGDEASAALESGRLVEWLITCLWGILSWLAGKPGAARTAVMTFIERNRWVQLIVPALAILAAVLFWKLPEKFGALLGAVFTVSGIIFAVVICAVLAAIVAQAILLVSILCLNIVRFGLGPTLQQTALIRVTSEPTPLGSWEVETFPSTGFGHGDIHEDAQVAEAIAEWVTREDRRVHRASGA